MKRNTFRFGIGLALLLLVTLATRAAELPVVAAWDFNVTGELHATQVSGEVRTLGGVSSSHLTGSSSDPAIPNLSLGVKGFPQQGMAVRSAGLEFMIDGTFARLGLAFDFRASPTACARLAVLVEDGAGEFQEAGTLVASQDSLFVPMALDLSGVIDPLQSGPTRVRIVADAGSDGLYPTVKPRLDGTNPYSPLGIWRFDRVVFRGVIRESVGQPLRISCARVDEDVALEWSHPDADQFTLWKAPSPSGPWVAVGLLYDTRSLQPVEEGMRFYRVTSP